MELTIESAFSTGGLVGNASYILLIASMAMRDIRWLRLLAIASGLTGIAYDAFWLYDPVGLFWETSFTLTNLVQWGLLVREERQLRLDARELGLWQRFFSDLSEVECKRLLMASQTFNGPAGQVLIQQDTRVEHVFMLLEGEAVIKVDGTTVSMCGPGDLLGEMSFLTGAPAGATTELASDARLMRIDQTNLASLVRSSPELASSINALISQNLVDKLTRQNAHNTTGTATRHCPQPAL